MSPADDRWLDHEAGPVVRPYALTGGRTRPSGEETFDLMAMVTAVRGAPASTCDLEPEHLTLLRLCRLPASVADLASDLDLPPRPGQLRPGQLRQMSTSAQSSDFAPGACIAWTSFPAPVPNPDVTSRSAWPSSRSIPASMSCPGTSISPSV